MFLYSATLVLRTLLFTSELLHALGGGRVAERLRERSFNVPTLVLAIRMLFLFLLYINIINDLAETKVLRLNLFGHLPILISSATHVT